MKKLFLAALLAACSLDADVALQAVAGGDVVSSSFLVTLSNRDFFFVTLDGGTPNTPAPSWLSVDQNMGYTDASISVMADPSKLQPGTFTGRFVIDFGTYPSTITQTVTLTVMAGQPNLDISPSIVALSAAQTSGVNQTDSVPIYVRNSGGGPQPFTASIVGDSSYLTLSSTSGQTDLTHPAFIITASTKGTLKAKAYAAAVVHVTSGSLTQDIPVTFLVTPSAQSFGLTKLGLVFRGQQGVGTQQTQTIQIPSGSGTVAWTASVTSAQDFVSVTPTTGSSSPGTSGMVTVAIKPNLVLQLGSYYALITVTPSAAGVSPVLATVVYIVTATAAYPTFSPSGLLFVAPLNTTTDPPVQTIPLYASTSTPLAFNVGQGGDLFDSITESGTVNGAGPASISVTPAYYATSKPGIFRGNVQVTFPTLGVTRTTDVLYVVLPAGAKPSAATSDSSRAVSNCTPSSISLLSTALSSGFSQPAGFPAVISTRVIDDCSNPVTNAKLALTFSNGDAPLIAALEDATTGTYSATWVPIHLTTGAVITARAAAGAFSASITTSGVVTSQTVPVVAPNAVLNNLNRHVGSPLAPGTISEIYGSGLADMPGSPSQLPLPSTFQNTSVQVAGLSAPLYYVSGGQLDAQLPAELLPNATYPIVVTNGNAISVPQMVTVTDVAPGVAATTDGQMIAQHANFAYVTADNPAKPSEVLIMYLVGLGATNPAVPSGMPAPGEPLARLVNSATVTVDGEMAIVPFAGLTPGAVGLYQIDFTVPADAKNGNLSVVVTQNGVVANTSTIPVAK